MIYDILYRESTDNAQIAVHSAQRMIFKWLSLCHDSEENSHGWQRE